MLLYQRKSVKEKKEYTYIFREKKIKRVRQNENELYSNRSVDISKEALVDYQTGEIIQNQRFVLSLLPSHRRPQCRSLLDRVTGKGEFLNRPSPGK